jgi:hypothetical protein
MDASAAANPVVVCAKYSKPAAFNSSEAISFLEGLRFIQTAQPHLLILVLSDTQNKRGMSWYENRSLAVSMFIKL